jgi:hypothetical protein
MLDRDTVFVIGAGAGFDIDMPLGDKLADQIADSLNFEIDGQGLRTGSSKILVALQRIAQRGPVSWERYSEAGVMISRGIRYSRSIDNYVHTHSDKEPIKTAAKVAIVQTILEAEGKCAIAIQPKIYPPRFREEQKARESWLSAFFSMLQDGVVEAKNLDAIFNNLTVINFNYDRCLEHFLAHAMMRLYPSKGDGYITNLIKTKLKILHPYGVIGSLPWQSEVDRVHFGGHPDENDLAGLSKRIRTYNEEVEDDKKIGEIRAALERAKRIVFLGFHFHKQNVELLAPEPHRPPVTGTVVIYGTSVGRSFADIQIIESQRVPKILHGRTVLPSSSFTTERGCKEFFRDFGGLLSG